MLRALVLSFFMFFSGLSFADDLPFVGSRLFDFNPGNRQGEKVIYWIDIQDDGRTEISECGEVLVYAMCDTIFKGEYTSEGMGNEDYEGWFVFDSKFAYITDGDGSIYNTCNGRGGKKILCKAPLKRKLYENSV